MTEFKGDKITNTPHLCLSCKKRRREEYGPGLAVGIRKDFCTSYVSCNKTEGTLYLSCEKAFRLFCQERLYKPTLWERIKRLIKGKQWLAFK